MNCPAASGTRCERRVQAARTRDHDRRDDRRQSGSSGTVAPGLGPAELLDRIPMVRDYADCEIDGWVEVPSHAIGFTEMLGLARRVTDALADPGLAGVVITHGTGTLEQTAYFLDVTLGHETAVVVTGALRNPSLPS